MIVVISCAILVLLFLAQSFGPAKIGGTFSPILLSLFVFSSGVGVYNIAVYDPTNFKVVACTLVCGRHLSAGLLCVHACAACGNHLVTPCFNLLRRRQSHPTTGSSSSSGVLHHRAGAFAILFRANQCESVPTA